MKKFTKLITLALALCMSVSMVLASSAAEIDQSGGSGTTPVSLTTTNGGIGGGDSGDVTPTKLNVVVPTSLPMAMSDNGTVVTATDCKIVNKSYGAVRVKTVNITAANGWKLTAFGDKTTLAGEGRNEVPTVDIEQACFFYFALRSMISNAIYRGNTLPLKLIQSPIKGCYMTGVGDSKGSSVGIEYAAIVTPLSNSVRNATIANVVIVVEWDIA